MKIPITICLLFFSLSSFAQNINQILQDADKQFQKSEYAKASELYEEALNISSGDLTAQYNLGVARFKLNNMDGATEAFKKALGLSKNKSTSALITYNLGVAYLKAANFQEAISAFQNSLKWNPDNKECRENLQFAINEYNKQLNAKQPPANKQESKMNQKQQKQQQKSEQNQLSKKTAKKLLESAQQEESRLRDSMRSKNSNAQKTTAKNW